MPPDIDKLLDQAFADHQRKQPEPHPTAYQEYWFGLGVKAMQPYVAALEEELRKISELLAVANARNGHS